MTMCSYNDQNRVALVTGANKGIGLEIARQLGSNRNAVYKLTHDARRKLRTHLTECGLAPDGWLEEDRR